MQVLYYTTSESILLSGQPSGPGVGKIFLPLLPLSKLPIGLWRDTPSSSLLSSAFISVIAFTRRTSSAFDSALITGNNSVSLILNCSSVYFLACAYASSASVKLVPPGNRALLDGNLAFDCRHLSLV